jgi:hypothetical protein
VAVYAGSVFKTHLRRLGSLRHQSKMNFASTSKDYLYPLPKVSSHPPHPNPLPPLGGEGTRGKNFWQTLYMSF